MNKPKLNPTVAFVIVAILIFIVVLVLIVRSDSGEPEGPERPVVQQPAEEPVESEQPGDSERPAEDPEDDEDRQEPELPLEESVDTPLDWNDLTPAQKTARNPFGCDHATQWVSAEDGRCIDRSAGLREGVDYYVLDSDECRGFTDGNGVSLDVCAQIIAVALVDGTTERIQMLRSLLADRSAEGGIHARRDAVAVYSYNGSSNREDYDGPGYLVGLRSPHTGLPGVQLLLDFGYTDCRLWEDSVTVFCSGEHTVRISTSYHEACDGSGEIVVNRYAYVTSGLLPGNASPDIILISSAISKKRVSITALALWRIRVYLPVSLRTRR